MVASASSFGSLPQPNGAPMPPPEPILSPPGYKFPHQNLKRRLTRPDRVPLVLVACGSFSPVTTLHLQMFELAEKYVKQNDPGFEIVGNYMSPCSDAYEKASLAPASHRIQMCSLAVDTDSKATITIDPWETVRLDDSGKPLYSPTVDVLRHFDHEINNVLGGIETLDGTFTTARVMLLIGADLAATMADPKLWDPSDIDVLLGHYGAFVVERTEDAIAPLKKYNKIWVVPTIVNEVSSTRVRAQIQNGERVEDIPDSVYKYIKLHHLYQKKPTTNGNPVEITNGKTD
ncbi:nicotinamide-nucleotide adenylyltransferase 2 [Trichoderma arundinaceum]|uniref:Nicotinamide-nucleotide adenylyltransferase n=1 Tax=Trichoderma arundinaceum TaxID=490622 RepID=A0A395N8W8_TRIAR|nr:nicotinamide-nucleotide adenylyltransferase 2 [Trichoderma arundinaceum]